jgi:hypothetical protein
MQEVFARDELASVNHLIISSSFLATKIINSLHCDDIYMQDCLFQCPTYSYHHFFLLTDYFPFNFILH